MKKTYLIKYVFLLFFVISAASVFAQTGVISGKVLDETSQPLPGATVTIKGTQTSTSTDASGIFHLKGIPASTVTVQISFIGYTTVEKTVAVSGNVTVNTSLVPNSKGLNEVVVIGYGTVQRKDVTGAIATVNAKDFQQGQNTSPLQLIAGKVAGVSIVSNSGAPGSGSTVRIRQGSSLNATNDPLYVIDGVPIENVGKSNAGDLIAGSADPLSLINPDDIETFTVLKDAASTAIYGSRASNGVILITTKKGKKGKPQITFSTKLSAANVAKYEDVLTADQVRAYVKAYDAANGSDKTALLGNANTNWQKEIYQTGVTTDNNLSVSGTSGFLPYRVSVGYLDQTGILRTDQLSRTTANISLTPSFFNNTLKVNFNLSGAQSNTRFANTGAIGDALSFDPTQPVKTAGSPYDGYTEFYNTAGVSSSGLNPNAPRNPVGALLDNHNNSVVDRSFGNFQVDYALPFVPGLHANYNFGFDVAKGSGQTNIPTNAGQSFLGTNGLGSYSPYASNYQNISSEFYLNYNKDIKSIKSNINVIAGYGYYNDFSQSDNERSLTAARDTVAGSSAPAIPISDYDNTLISYYGRLIYTFDDKYILQGSIRRDGSSRFAPAERWSNFPGVALTWRVINEDFLKNQTVLSDLKVRASFGVTGQQDFGQNNDYDFIPAYFIGSGNSQYEFGNTFYTTYKPGAYTSNLKWEQTASTDIGVDYGFLNNRITGSIDVYYKNTTDLLSDVKVASGANFSTEVFTNIGDMVNRGLEFNITAAAIKKSDMAWNINFNMAYQASKITNLTLSKDPNFQIPIGGINGSLGAYAQAYAVGYVPGVFNLENQVYGANGKPIEGVYVSSNGVSPDFDLEHSPLPKFIYGFSTDFTYKKWTISTVLRANFGNYVYNNVAENLGTGQNILPTSFQLVDNASTSIYKTGFQVNQPYSNYYLENASFLKMDNAGLAYNVGHIFHNKNINLGVNANVQNVFTITKYTGIDPEVIGGIDNNSYPRPRTYTLGINLGL